MAVNTRAPSTIVTIDLTGQSDFNIPFEYLARKFVEVTLLGINRLPLTLNTDYRFVSKTMISLTKPYSGDYNKIEIRRVTSASERLVDFHDGSILRAYDLNLSQIQTLHVAEEARDLTADTIGVNDKGHLDARGRKIVNLGKAEDGGDAVNFAQLWEYDTSTLNNANRAQAQADRAEQQASYADSRALVSQQAADAAQLSANHAETMASEAYRHATSADAHAVKAGADATRAEQAKDSIVGSEAFCTQEANRAHTEANRAEAEASKLQNMNDFAQTITSVLPDRVQFNRGLWGLGEAGVVAYGSAGDTPWNGLWRGGVGEGGFYIDGNGTIGMSAKVGSPFWWFIDNTRTAMYFTLNNLIHTGNMWAREGIHSKTRMVVGQDDVSVNNSTIVHETWNDSSSGNWVNKSIHNWYTEKWESGIVRGNGAYGNALTRYTDMNGVFSDVEQTSGSWSFNQGGTPSFKIYSDGNFEMRWAGGKSMHTLLAEKKWARRSGHTYLGAIAIQDGYQLDMPRDVRGLDGFFIWEGVRVQIQFPSSDCDFQTNRGGDWQHFRLSNSGQRLTRIRGYGEGGANYDFYLDE